MTFDFNKNFLNFSGCRRFEIDFVGECTDFGNVGFCFKVSSFKNLNRVGRSVESVNNGDCVCVAVDSVENEVSRFKQLFVQVFEFASAVENRSGVAQCKVERFEKAEFLGIAETSVERHEELRENLVCRLNRDFDSVRRDVSRLVDCVNLAALCRFCFGVEPRADKLVSRERCGNAAEIGPF